VLGSLRVRDIKLVESPRVVNALRLRIHQLGRPNTNDSGAFSLSPYIKLTIFAYL
jgi:hypothetical protein